MYRDPNDAIKVAKNQEIISEEIDDSLQEVIKEHQKRIAKKDLYWLSVADKIAEKSKCQKRHIGVIILDRTGRVISTAYNGHPRNTYCDNECIRKTIHTHKKMAIGYCCHSEINALIFADFDSLQGATIYLTAPPCEACAPYLIQSGLCELVYYKDEYAEPGVEMIKKLTTDSDGISCFKIRSYNQQVNERGV